jgi:hypothetical protein
MDVYPIVAYALPRDVFNGPLPSNGCPSIVGCALAGTCSPSTGVFWPNSLMLWANPSQYLSDLQIILQNPTGWGIATEHTYFASQAHKQTWVCPHGEEVHARKWKFYAPTQDTVFRHELNFYVSWKNLRNTDCIYSEDPHSTQIFQDSTDSITRVTFSVW